jgi:uncharacterized repeat protein (TIGR03803 family)
MKINHSVVVRLGAWLSVAAILCSLSGLASAANPTPTLYGLHPFTDSDGSGSAFGLISDAAGNLYGARSAGGAYGYGTVYKLAPSYGGGYFFSVIYNFTGGQDGSNPDWGRLAVDAAGNLYMVPPDTGATTEWA